MSSTPEGVSGSSPTPPPPPTPPNSPEGPPGPPPNQARPLGWFSNLALAMSTICILAGGITSFSLGLCSVGGGSIGIGWLVGCLFALVVALTMGEIASAFHHSGGPSEWTTQLGQRGWGWVAGCFNLAGLSTAAAAVNRGLADFIIGAMSRKLEYDPAKLDDWIPRGGTALITLTQVLLACFGMNVTKWITNASGIVIMAFAAALTVCLIGFAVAAPGGWPLDFSRLVTFTNYSGVPAASPVWPAQTSLGWLFLLGLLLPAYTVTGFDASAQTADETQCPQVNVPRGIVYAVLISGFAGWVMLSAVILAAPGPNLNAAATEGSQSFFWILREVTDTPTSYFGQVLRGILYTGIDFAQYACGLASLIAASRLAHAMARRGGLPHALGHPLPPLTPVRAVCAVGAVTMFIVLCIKYTTIAAVCATFLYVAYVIPTAWGFLRHRMTATGAHFLRKDNTPEPVGPWRPGWAGWLYRPLAIICVLGCGLLILIGFQPPNEIALPIVAGMAVGLVILWFWRVQHHYH